MKKLLSILALLLVLTASLSAPVLADEVRGTELQLIVTETPTPTPEPTVTPAPTPPENSAPQESPLTENPVQTEVRNPVTGNPMTLKEIGVVGMAVAALILTVCMAAAQHKKKIHVK
ncbi:hypothetical protein [Eubacterium limosum]|jgi:multisubunit Na+/H+ antiporter MnhC subunit|uniref:Uncharacterized protein n=1 Tax=Eubacterium limosum TaxID=1736 RepID=A0AAC9QVT5_EUBLI|nr:hypothetical protein [Eubacterium limosum]ARD66541.1 hypothetical protein B2M23_13800 [Eubacterium limosum]PWW49683.1 hypothetical protein C7955_1115 [Eubacterium limosum]UQZ22454.1 hypothetical protein M5595_19930 [Eubacterium limosum]